MNRNSNTYTLIYTSILVVVVAAILAFVSASLKERQNSNIRTEKMQYILGAAGLAKDAMTASDRNAYVKGEYDKYIVETFVVNAQGEKVEGNAFDIDMKPQRAMMNSGDKNGLKLPVFVAKLDNGKTVYIVSVYGAGLWGPIWGYISLEEDFNHIYGAIFDHQGETPGLGAEITKDFFKEQFKEKVLFNDTTFQPLEVVKGGKGKGDAHKVDAITGGTMTSRGVQDMLKVCLEHYLPFFEKCREAQSTTMVPEASAEETSQTDKAE